MARSERHELDVSVFGTRTFGLLNYIMIIVWLENVHWNIHFLSVMYRLSFSSLLMQLIRIYQGIWPCIRKSLQEDNWSKLKHIQVRPGSNEYLSWSALAEMCNVIVCGREARQSGGALVNKQPLNRAACDSTSSGVVCSSPRLILSRRGADWGGASDLTKISPSRSVWILFHWNASCHDTSLHHTCSVSLHFQPLCRVQVVPTWPEPNVTVSIMSTLCVPGLLECWTVGIWAGSVSGFPVDALVSRGRLQARSFPFAWAADQNFPLTKVSFHEVKAVLPWTP